MKSQSLHAKSASAAKKSKSLSAASKASKAAASKKSKSLASLAAKASASAKKIAASAKAASSSSKSAASAKASLSAAAAKLASQEAAASKSFAAGAGGAQASVVSAMSVSAAQALASERSIIAASISALEAQASSASVAQASYASLSLNIAAQQSSVSKATASLAAEIASATSSFGGVQSSFDSVSSALATATSAFGAATASLASAQGSLSSAQVALSPVGAAVTALAGQLAAQSAAIAASSAAVAASAAAAAASAAAPGLDSSCSSGFLSNGHCVSTCPSGTTAYTAGGICCFGSVGVTSCTGESVSELTGCDTAHGYALSTSGCVVATTTCAHATSFDGKYCCADPLATDCSGIDLDDSLACQNSILSYKSASSTSGTCGTTCSPATIYFSKANTGAEYCAYPSSCSPINAQTNGACCGYGMASCTSKAVAIDCKVWTVAAPLGQTYLLNGLCTPSQADCESGHGSIVDTTNNYGVCCQDEFALTCTSNAATGASTSCQNNYPLVLTGANTGTCATSAACPTTPTDTLLTVDNTCIDYTQCTVVSTNLVECCMPGASACTTAKVATSCEGSYGLTVDYKCVLGGSTGCTNQQDNLCCADVNAASCSGPGAGLATGCDSSLPVLFYDASGATTCIASCDTNNAYGTDGKCRAKTSCNAATYSPDGSSDYCCSVGADSCTDSTHALTCDTAHGLTTDYTCAVADSPECPYWTEYPNVCCADPDAYTCLGPFPGETTVCNFGVLQVESNDATMGTCVENCPNGHAFSETTDRNCKPAADCPAGAAGTTVTQDGTNESCCYDPHSTGCWDGDLSQSTSCQTGYFITPSKSSDTTMGTCGSTCGKSSDGVQFYLNTAKTQCVASTSCSTPGVNPTTGGGYCCSDVNASNCNGNGLGQATACTAPYTLTLPAGSSTGYCPLCGDDQFPTVNSAGTTVCAPTCQNAIVQNDATLGWKQSPNHNSGTADLTVRSCRQDCINAGLGYTAYAATYAVVNSVDTSACYCYLPSAGGFGQAYPTSACTYVDAEDQINGGYIGPGDNSDPTPGVYHPYFSTGSTAAYTEPACPPTYALAMSGACVLTTETGCPNPINGICCPLHAAACTSPLAPTSCAIGYHISTDTQTCASS